MKGGNSPPMNPPRTAVCRLLAVAFPWVAVRMIVAAPMSFDGGGAVAIPLAAGEWSHHEIEVPSHVDGEAVLGWELRVTDWDGGLPQLVVRRELPPERLGDLDEEGRAFSPATALEWLPGRQIQGRPDPWTGRRSASGSDLGVDRILTVPMGNPLEPGSYRVAVLNAHPSETCVFTLRSRAIGRGMSLDVVDATVGGDLAIPETGPRQPFYVRYVVPEPLPGLSLRLENGGGESMMTLREGFLPSSLLGGRSYYPPFRDDGGLPAQTELRMAGDEKVTVLPLNGAGEIPAGVYYAMVVGEGHSPPDPWRIGSGNVSATLSSAVPGAEHLGEASTGTPLAAEGALDAGEVAFFRFSVPGGATALAVTLEGGEGRPCLALRSEDDGLPGWWGGYGLAGGQTAGHHVDTRGTITLATPRSGDYALLVRGLRDEACSFSLRIGLQDAAERGFDDGAAPPEVLGPRRWSYHRVTVPHGVALGWELRVSEWSGGDPWLVLRRDLPPDYPGNRAADGSEDFSPGDATSFDPGQQHATGHHPWSGRTSAADAPHGMDRILMLATGNPLEPGDYHIGVFNASDAEDCHFRLVTRGIGPGLKLPVIDAVPGSVVAGGGLGPGDVAVFRHVLPAPLPAWRFELGFPETTPEGEGMLLLRQGMVPNSQRRGRSHHSPQLKWGGLEVQTELTIPGGERTVLLPEPGEELLPAGVYYTMVVSEGNAPENEAVVGPGTVDFELADSTEVPVTDLGTVAVDESAESSGSLPAGGVAFFRYEVEDSSLPLEYRLEGSGGGRMSARLAPGDGPPVSTGRSYGTSGGREAGDIVEQGLVFTIAAPEAGSHSMTVHGDGTPGEFHLSLVRRTIRSLGFAGGGGADPPSSASFDLLNGQCEFFEVEVPAEVDGRLFLGWLLRLDLGEGMASVSARKDRLPLAGGGSSETPAGEDFLYVGETFLAADGKSAALSPGLWYVQVQAEGMAKGTVSSEPVFAWPLDFDARIGLDGAEAEGELDTGEKRFFVVDVPPELTGEEVLGWALKAEGEEGRVTLRISRDTLPISHGSNPREAENGLLLLDAETVPAGRYFVEVAAEEATSFRIVSRGVSAADVMRTWTMPEEGRDAAAPGVEFPYFGDSGLDPAGAPVSGDLGTDLEPGAFHVHTMVVPDDNEGVLRAELFAMTGNPDLYIRHGAIGSEEAGYDCRLRNDVPLDYGTWVADDGYFSKRLKPGLHFIVVRASGAGPARYRLRLSPGLIQDLEMDGGSATGQTIGEGDWGHYRVRVPMDPPEYWRVSFTRSGGPVEMYIRDSAPPGHVGADSDGSVDSWVDEPKNQGGYTYYTDPVTAVFSPPQVRPGHTYYIGFRALGEAVFSVHSRVFGFVRPDPPVVGFISGGASGVLPPGGKAWFRVPVPADAAMWKHRAVHSGAVSVFIEQGSFPSESPSDDAVFEGMENSEWVKPLAAGVSSWPWVPGESYYVAFVNGGTEEEPFSFFMEGEAPSAHDSDGNGIPDAWELANLGASGHPADRDEDDRDGVPLLLEYFFGLDPRKADHPWIEARMDGPHFSIDFRKRSATPSLVWEIQATPSLGREPWAKTAAELVKLYEEGAMEVWRARVPVAADVPSMFYRIRVGVPP